MADFCIGNFTHQISHLKLLFAILVVLVTPGKAAASQDLPPGLQDLFARGVEALKSGQLDAAEEAFKRVLHDGGRVSFVYNNLGIVYQQRGQHENAAEQFREAIRLQPDYPAPRILLGASLMALHKAPEAVRQLEQAVKLQPNEPLARQQLAKAYQQTDNLLGVVEQYQALRATAPEEPEYAYQSGNVYIKRSIWVHQQIRRINPQSVRFYQTLGENFLVQGRTEQAIQYLQLAARADSKTSGIHLSLAEIYLDQGKLSAASREVEQELVIVPESVTAPALGQKISDLEKKH